jgi:hypothetical protein
MSITSKYHVSLPGPVLRASGLTYTESIVPSLDIKTNHVRAYLWTMQGMPVLEVAASAVLLLGYAV